MKKKLLSVFLTTILVLSSVPSVYTEGEKQTFYFNDTFDSYTKVEDVKGLNMINPVELAEDENGGKALKLNLTKEQNNTRFQYLFDEPVTSGSVKISYSVKPGSGMSTHVTVHDRDGANHFTTMFMEWSKTFSSGYCWVDPAYTLGAFDMEKWYDIEAIINLDVGSVSVTMTDESGNVYVAPNTMLQMGDVRIKDIADIDFQVWSNADSSSLFDNIKIEKMPFAWSVENIGQGNITGEKNPPIANISFVNYVEKDSQANLKWQIYDDYGIFVDEGETEIYIKGNSTEKTAIDLNVSKYGIYNVELEVNIVSNDGVYSFSDNTEFNFSKVISQPNGVNSDFIQAAFHFHGGEHDKAINLADTIGLEGLRWGLYWWENEKESKKNYLIDDMHLQNIERMHAVGMKPLINLMGHNSLYFNELPSWGVYMPETDEQIEAFADWCGWVAKTLKGKAEYFEIWNEPNVNGFNIKNCRGEVYSKLLRAAYNAIKKENPNAYVLGLGGADYDYLKSMLEADPQILDYCDAVSIHPYDRNLWDNPKFPDIWLNTFSELKELMAQYGYDKPIWNTEMGWATYDMRHLDDPYHDPATPLQQAQKLVQAATVLRAYDAADKMTIYSFMDEGNDNWEAEHRWGMVTYYGDSSDGGMHAKKSYISVGTHNALFSDVVSFDRSAEKNLSKTAAYSFKTNKGYDLAVLWSVNKDQVISLDLGCKSVDLYDIYGNFIETQYGENGIFCFGVSENVYYIKGNFAKFKVAEDKFEVEDIYLRGPLGDTTSFVLKSADKKRYDILTEVSEDDFEYKMQDILINGKKKISFKSIGDRDGEFPVRIKVYDEGNCVFVYDDFITVQNSTDVAIEANQVSKYTGNRWQLEVTIKNNANTIAVGGTCRVVSPPEFAQHIGEIKFREIDPHSQRKIYFNLPELVKKRSKTIVVELELENGYKEQYEEKMDFTSAKYAGKKPVIDGIISKQEWSSSVAASDALSDIYTQQTSAHQWGGTEDLSASKIQMMWDEDNLYFTTTIRDDIFVQTDAAVDLWKYDSVQFGIEDLNNNGAAATSHTFTEIGLALKKNGTPTVYRYSSLYAKPTMEVTNCEVAISRNGNDTIYELSIPWNELFTDNYSFNESTIFGFSMIGNDNDGEGRWGWVCYNEGIGDSKDSVFFGKMRLYK